MRTSPLTPLVVLLLVALTACGTDAEPTQAPTSTGHSQLPVSIIDDAFARSMESTFSFQITLSAASEQVTVSGEMDPTTGAVRVGGSLGPEVLQMIFVDGMVYVRSGGHETESWVSYDLRRLEEIDSSWSRTFDVRAQADIFEGLVSVTEVGPGRYEAIADLRRAGLKRGDPQMVIMGSLVNNGRGIPIEVTIDPEGRLTRLFFAVEMAGQRVESELIISDFGLPVEIVAPEAELVVEATDEMYRERV